MLLSEIRDEVVIARSGQFILDPEDLEVDDKRFRVLVQSVLRKYNRYSPAHGKYNITTPSTNYTFLASASLPTLTGYSVKGIPDWLAGVLPIRSSGGFGIFQTIGLGDQFHFPDLEKMRFAWEYRKPTLYVPFSGQFEVTWVKNHTVTQDENDNYQVETIGADTEDHDTFFGLLTGSFLQTIGRYRRAFTIQEIPITMDASELVSEGNEMMERAEEDLKENQHKFYLAGYGN